MKNDRLYELISRKLAGEATPEEIEELREYFQKNPHDQYFNELISSYWNSLQHRTEEEEADSDEHFNHILQMADESLVNVPKINEQIDELAAFENNIRKKRKRRIVTSFAIAASFLIIIFLSWWFSSGKTNTVNSPAITQSEVVANKGIRSRIILPDSSTVYLNSDTKLNYPQKFSDNIREVYLDGEAFFDVKKDPSKPFIVHTAGIQVKVLGTTFNVKAYSTDKQIETSLITGSIEVSLKNRPTERYFVSPNEKLIIKNTWLLKDSVSKIKEKVSHPDITIDLNPLSPDPKDNTITETQWIENKLVFRDEPFPSVVKMMERWYNVPIEIEDDELLNINLTGTFKTETIEQALDALKFTKNFRYKTIGNTIKIYR